jgi:poly(A) polymerase
MKIIKLLKGLWKRRNNQPPASLKNKLTPRIIPRASHGISRQNINPNALKVLYRLHQANFGAYLVGGCVRDLLLGRRPKDFDIATNALPEEVRKLFKNCRLIGKRFRLAHIIFGKDIIEVATFRTNHENALEHHGKTHQGMIVRDNVYGKLEDDVLRRDFTVNALYYNIADFSIVDFVQGAADIDARLLRIIGNPLQRFQEDPVRLVRAVRFMGKLNLTLSLETQAPFAESSHLLQNVAPARLFQEVLKLFQEGATVASFGLLQKYHLLERLFPQTAASLADPIAQELLNVAFSDTDERIKNGKTVSPAFLLTILLWQPIWQSTQKYIAEGMPAYTALETSLNNILKLQTQQLAVPRNLLSSVREICILQHYFNYRHGAKVYRTLNHPRFRAAYDLLLLRAKSGENVAGLAQWWMEFNAGDAHHRDKLLNKNNKQRRKKSRPKVAKVPSAIHKDLPTE